MHSNCFPLRRRKRRRQREISPISSLIPQSAVYCTFPSLFSFFLQMLSLIFTPLPLLTPQPTHSRIGERGLLGRNSVGFHRAEFSGKGETGKFASGLLLFLLSTLPRLIQYSIHRHAPHSVYHLFQLSFTHIAFARPTFAKKQHIFLRMANSIHTQQTFRHRILRQELFSRRRTRRGGWQCIAIQCCTSFPSFPQFRERKCTYENWIFSLEYTRQSTVLPRTK